MNTKHQPATPLPWRAEKWSSHAASTVLVDDTSVVTGKRVVADCEAYDPAERGQDAVYIVHAANAYQKLVERTTKRAAFLRLIVERMPKDVRPLYEEALGAEAASDESLLRELGEAS